MICDKCGARHEFMLGLGFGNKHLCIGCYKSWIDYGVKYNLVKDWISSEEEKLKVFKRYYNAWKAGKIVNRNPEKVVYT